MKVYYLKVFFTTVNHNRLHA